MTSANVQIAALVTGSRGWADRQALWRELDALARPGCTLVVIEGGARGADAQACLWARERGHPVLTMAVPAGRWERLGPVAGHVRNRLMVLVLRCLRWCGWECHVLACPLAESRGTWHCYRAARRAGFEPRIVRAGL